MPEIKFYGENGLTMSLAQALKQKSRINEFLQNISFLGGSQPIKSLFEDNYSIYLFYCFGRSSKKEKGKEDSFLVTFGEPDMIIPLDDLLLIFEVKTGKIAAFDQPTTEMPGLRRHGIWYEILRFYYAGSSFRKNEVHIIGKSEEEWRYHSNVDFYGLDDKERKTPQKIMFRYRLDSNSPMRNEFKKLFVGRDFRVIVISSDEDENAPKSLLFGIDKLKSIEPNFDAGKIGWIGTHKFKEIFDVDFGDISSNRVYRID